MLGSLIYHLKQSLAKGGSEGGCSPEARGMRWLVNGIHRRFETGHAAARLISVSVKHLLWLQELL